MRNLTHAEMIMRWPKLTLDNYRTTSQATARYNCLAFVNGDERHWWDLDHGGRYFWPDSIPKDWTKSSFMKLFISNGYVTGSSHTHENGKQKIAIYVNLDDLQPSHVAISNGTTWKSKLGAWQDVEHDSLDVFEGDGEFDYGVVDVVLEKFHTK